MQVAGKHGQYRQLQVIMEVAGKHGAPPGVCSWFGHPATCVMPYHPATCVITAPEGGHTTALASVFTRPQEPYRCVDRNEAAGFCRSSQHSYRALIACIWNLEQYNVRIPSKTNTRDDSSHSISSRPAQQNISQYCFTDCDR